MIDEMIFWIGSLVLVSLGVYIWLRIRKAYSKEETLPPRVAILIWFFHIIHHSLVILSALYGVWALPVNKVAALAVGSVLFAVGITTVSLGLIEFRSFHRAAGLDSSKLITTGIYQYSRNPQHLGLFLWLLGISLMGRSGLAFSFTLAFIIYMHLYTIRLEEPYLERVFGEEYYPYKSRVGRYITIKMRERDAK